MNPVSGVGFLFINNHQRKRRMEERRDAAVRLVFPEEELVIDHLFLKPGSCAVIPFSLPVGGAFLEKTNASLLCCLGSRYFFYGSKEVCENPFYQWRGKAGDVVTLTEEQAARACRLGDALYVTEYPDSCLIEQEEKIYLISSHAQEKVICYREEGEPNVLTVKAQEVNVPVRFAPLAPRIDGDMGDKMVEEKGYCEYEVCLGDVPVDKLHQMYLEADYVGDRAELYLDGRLADDWFTTGETWHAALKRFDYPVSMVIRVYSSDCPIPNPYEDQVYYDLPVEKGCALRGVKAVAEYKTLL